jgi:hypothetical protein
MYLFDTSESMSYDRFFKPKPIFVPQFATSQNAGSISNIPVDTPFGKGKEKDDQIQQNTKTQPLEEPQEKEEEAKTEKVESSPVLETCDIPRNVDINGMRFALQFCCSSQSNVEVISPLVVQTYRGHLNVQTVKEAYVKKQYLDKPPE